jgi:hypothetical protein
MKLATRKNGMRDGELVVVSRDLTAAGDAPIRLELGATVESFTAQPGGLLGGFRGAFSRFWSGVGLWVIMIALGALFANAAMSRITLLIGRVQWLQDAFGSSGLRP